MQRGGVLRAAAREAVLGRFGLSFQINSAAQNRINKYIAFYSGRSFWIRRDQKIQACVREKAPWLARLPCLWGDVLMTAEFNCSLLC